MLLGIAVAAAAVVGTVVGIVADILAETAAAVEAVVGIAAVAFDFAAETPALEGGESFL